MSNLIKYLPKHSPIVEAIYRYHKQRGDSGQGRGYLGASIIGHPCERYLWFTFRSARKPEHDGRLYRLFETGNLEEVRFVKELRGIGCTVYDVDPNTEKQFEVSALGGHFSGHMDGCAIGIPEAPKTWHALEFKTHNAKSFAKLIKEGVKASKPQHYAQMMAYMHLMKMTRALYLAVNKDTDDLYSERVRYNKDEAVALMERARRVIESSTPSERISERQDWYECRYCDAHSICWGNSQSVLPLPQVSCRQCCHATPITEGEPEPLDNGPRWRCSLHDKISTNIDLGANCKDHLVLPGMIACAIPVDYGQDHGGHWIDFSLLERQPNDDQIFRHGADGYSTRELISLSPSEATNRTLATAKGLFGATVERVSKDDTLSRYPESDSRIVWKGPLKGLRAAWLEAYGEDMGNCKIVGKFDEWDYKAVEFEGGRVAIVWNHIDGRYQAEIRQGIE